LIDEDFQGKRSYHQIITTKPLSIRLADIFILEQNYPNPFNRETNISFSVPAQNSPLTEIEINIYNAGGQKVVTLIKDNFEPGNYNIRWNGEDNSGKEMPSGVYFYQLNSREVSQSAKMILLK
jgi:flagellar hook assembly protein FlgD